MTGNYLLAGQQSELDRLKLQAEVWEQAGRDLLSRLGDCPRRRGVDIGCGALGWLRILSAWADEVTGTDIQPAMLDAAGRMVEEEALGNVELVEDDLFDSRLPAGEADLVHARFQIAPLGRGTEQLAAYLRLVRPGGVLVLEDPDTGSWHYNPPAPAAERLGELVKAGFIRSGGDLDAGRQLPGLLAGAGLKPELNAVVHALPNGHPYARVVIAFATSLRPRLLEFTPERELDALMHDAEQEIASCWSTTWTLIQAWARVG